MVDVPVVSLVPFKVRLGKPLAIHAEQVHSKMDPVNQRARVALMVPTFRVLMGLQRALNVVHVLPTLLLVPRVPLSKILNAQLVAPLPIALPSLVARPVRLVDVASVRSDFLTWLEVPVRPIPAFSVATLTIALRSLVARPVRLVDVAPVRPVFLKWLEARVRPIPAFSAPHANQGSNSKPAHARLPVIAPVLSARRLALPVKN
jgi:hypothetical protein